MDHKQQGPLPPLTFTKCCLLATLLELRQIFVLNADPMKLISFCLLPHDVPLQHYENNEPRLIQYDFIKFHQRNSAPLQHNYILVLVLSGHVKNVWEIYEDAIIPGHLFCFDMLRSCAQFSAVQIFSAFYLRSGSCVRMRSSCSQAPMGWWCMAAMQILMWGSRDR